jgi:hypothetical protein
MCKHNCKSLYLCWKFSVNIVYKTCKLHMNHAADFNFKNCFPIIFFFYQYKLLYHFIPGIFAQGDLNLHSSSPLNTVGLTLAFMLVHCSVYSILKMKAIRSSKTSIDFQCRAQHYWSWDRSVGIASGNRLED